MFEWRRPFEVDWVESRVVSQISRLWDRDTCGVVVGRGTEPRLILRPGVSDASSRAPREA